MKYILLLLSLTIAQLSISQNEEDVLRYSFHNSFTTARSAGMGGAFGALGADLSSMNSNPAGLGLYRRGDFSFTPNFGGSTSASSFSGENTKDSDFHLKVNSIGFVTTQDSDKPNIQKVSFGIAYNRMANFNKNVSISGFNSNSLLDVFADRAQGINYNNIYDLAPISSVLAWDAFLIDTISGAVDQYESAIPAGGTDHEIRIEQNGGMGEMLFGGGANIGDRFYWGLTIGLPIVRYTEELTHKETPKNVSGPLQSFTYTENLDVTGGGINAKLGVILKVSQKLRIGAAYHTRTSLSLTDTYSSGITANFLGNEITPDDAPGIYDYRIVIPSKILLNASFIAGKNALVSADYEFTNYASGKLKRSNLSIDTYDFGPENQIVNDIYKETHNVKVGAEFRVANSYRIRFGTRYMQNPYAIGVVGEKVSGAIVTYSLGAGLRKKSLYADIAGSYSQRNTGHFMYDSNYVDEALIKTNRINFLITVGMRI